MVVAVAKFKAARKIYNLRFEGEYDGLEIRAHGLTMGRMLEIADQADRLEAGAGLAETRELIEAFVSKVKVWNLQHETLDDQYEDTPIQVDAFLAHDPGLVRAAVRAWVVAIVGVDEELGKDSSSGASFPEESLPMERL